VEALPLFGLVFVEALVTVAVYHLRAWGHEEEGFLVITVAEDAVDMLTGVFTLRGGTMGLILES
jgi:hypothetical protein